MSALADTSVLIDYLRGIEPARQLLRSALVNGLELWTLNVRHFPMFDGLRPPW